MTSFVLDNSISMRWLLASNNQSNQQYAESVLLSLVDAEAIVPNLWHLEAANVFLAAEKRQEVDFTSIENFIDLLKKLPIKADPLTFTNVFSSTLKIAKKYQLSSYDAAYLELSIRKKLPIATLDQRLLKAAKNANVEEYLV